MKNGSESMIDDTSANLEIKESKTEDFSNFNENNVRLRGLRNVKETDGCKICCKRMYNNIINIFKKCGLCQDNLNESQFDSPPKRHIYYGPSYDTVIDGNNYVKEPHLDDEENSAFVSNYISTQKYSIYTFIPINLFEQFRRVANLYFLFIAVLATTNLSPKDPLFTIFPLCVVLLISAIKEAYEDYQRYKQDKEINHRKSMVYRPDPENNGHDWKFREIFWKDIEVGDIVKIDKNKRSIPADIMILQSSTKQGLCNIETSNLDGETNLKIKQAVGVTYSIKCGENGDEYPCQNELQFKLESEAPNERLNEWKGVLYFNNNSDPVSVTINQLLIRGCTLRNTDWIIGIVIYTGKESKLSLNNKESPLKRSHVDTLVDYAIYFIFVVQFLLCIFGITAHYLYLRNNASNEWYQYINSDGTNNANIIRQSFLNYFTFMVLLDLVVPISLYVSIEVVKVMQIITINNDNAMTYNDPENEFPPIKPLARTSNLNEELGQVSFIFSDKTGTLTQNKMEFLRCHVGKTRYGPGEMELQNDICERIQKPDENMPDFDVKKCRFTDNRLAARSQNDKEINEFLTLLTTCHNIIPEHPAGIKGPIIYNASSPDEKALVILAKNLHYYFYEGHVQIIEYKDKKIDGYRYYVNVFGNELQFDIYNMLEFTSKRKRMSIITKDPRDNLFKLYIKGADNVIYNRLTNDSKKEKWELTLESIKTFAEQGLRTLVCGYKVISDDEYYSWLNELNKAKANLQNRSILIEQLYDKLEQDITLLGATAIEDKLQDGVDNSISDFTVAGISLWVLTGDKVETAINIGKSAKLLKPKMNVTIIDPSEKLSKDDTNRIVNDEFDKANKYLKNVEDNCETEGLVISGKALSIVFPARKHTKDGKEIKPTIEEEKHEHEMQQKFLKICLKCRAVLCCRVSPIQKAQVVKLVRFNKDNIITLAIGDGANDVPMIRAAHVGIGISGQEGLQAVMASDYSIAQFKYLKELLFVHGAWNYRRISILILYTFHKTICFCLIQVWFSIYNGYSGTLFYDDFSGSILTLVFLNFPALSLGILDRQYSKEIARICPELYSIGPNNGYFSTKIFLRWCIEAVISSLIIFYFNVFFIDSAQLRDGKIVGFWVSATTQFTSIILVLTARIMLETKTWTYWTWIWLILSILSWFAFTLVWNILPLTWWLRHYDVYNVSPVMMRTSQFWFIILLNTVTAMLPIILYKFIKKYYFPTRHDVIEELELNQNRRLKFLKSFEEHKYKSIDKEPLQSKSLETDKIMDKNDFH